MAEQSPSKKKLRQFFLEKRSALSEELVEEKSNDIIHRVLKSKEFGGARTVHSYISIEENNEVNTKPFIHACLRKNKTVVVPKIVGEGELDHIQITSFNELEVNEWGVPEPSDGPKISVDKIDLVIVPMVAG
ncbi:MAG: 5-formyltetrahydrofolate cyclo-ligase, partial [Balneolaceae bacterium]|nr:5-formyltetrahydrofolate cyclo-ligase [Balneolaceae bacterium]